MSNKRKRYRENKKRAKQEERLNSNNEFGIHDPTPRAAVIEIMERDKRKEKKQ